MAAITKEDFDKIKPGMQVRCVTAIPNCELLTNNKVYTIKEITNNSGNLTPCLMITSNDGRDYYWLYYRFELVTPPPPPSLNYQSRINLIEIN